MNPSTLDVSERLIVSTPGCEPDPGIRAHLATHGVLTVPVDDQGWRSGMSRAIAESGVLGQGGAGFPCGIKWEAMRRSSRRAVVVVNAMEGEPASAKDRLLLARCPHLVLDGAEVAAAVIGASEIVVCVPDHSDASATSVARAVAEREQTGVARHRTSVVRPPGRYVAGEESALASWLDGRAPLPTFRVDKSVPLMVGRRAVLVHNAETLCQVALVARHGPQWFRRRGRPDAPGTTLVTLSGAVPSPTVMEVEFGTPVADIVARAGVVADLTAVLVGGYGGTWLDAVALETPYAPGPLTAVGAAPGVGVLVALPVTSCGIAETARLAGYLAGESAGQCGPCVFGLPAMAADLALLAEGQADFGVLDRIERRASQINGRGACRHPDGAVRLVRSALGVFADDARRHQRGHPCSAHRAPTVMTLPPPVTMSGLVP